MKRYNLKLNVTTALAALLTASILSSTAAAAPGTISSQPLQTSASAESNVMFVLDSSGSMDIISPEPVPGTYSYTCSNATAKIADGTSLELNVDGSGASSVPKIEIGGTDYDLGNTASGTVRCFDPSYTYYANLNDGLGTATWNQVPYDGNYLNWYFDISTDSGSDEWDTKNYKPGSRNRMEVAQNALNGLIDTLKSVNVGLTTFNGGNGADIDVPIAAINTSHATTLKNAVTATTPGGSTPLAETLRDIGRYFASGDGNNSSTSGACGGSASTLLYLHPGDVALNTSIACDDLLTTDTSNGDDYNQTSNVTGSGPIEFFCQKNFAVMLTDGFPTSDSEIPDELKDYDQDCTTAAETLGSYTCDSSDDTKSYDPGPESDYWDDVAMALHDIDLRPDLNDQEGKPYPNNLSTFTIGFADKQIKDLQLIKDVANQSGGNSYYAADSADLEQILTDLNAELESQSGTAAAVTFNSSTLSSQSAVYQALFNTQRWSGQLHSFPLDGFTGDIITTCTIGTNNCWIAEEMLEAQTSRTILTYNPVSKQGVDFDYTASTTDYSTITSSDNTSSILPKTMIDDFCASHDIPFPCNASTTANSVNLDANKVYMEALVDYIRGDRTHEVKGTDYNFRERSLSFGKLGDIVNSSPVYVGKPALGWPSTAPFPTTTADTYFTWSNSSVKNRMPIVYVGANDGMLHGFRTLETDPAASSADAGQEVLAFIPSSTADSSNNSGLHYLANPNYQHKFYVDLNPALSDVFIKHRDTTSGAVTASAEWRTVLVGGQGAGGNTMFMLDVTDPGQFSATNVKQLIEWEFSQPDMGYTYSKPTIAMMNNGRFAAIFGNGYNSDTFGGDCKAKLFVVFLDGGVDGVWNQGTDPSSSATDYIVYDTTIGSTGDCNGLSTPAVVDLNRDRVADKVYAGDLHGNLWSFDLCNYDTGASECQDTGWSVNATPIMTTLDNRGGTAIRQPITVKPVVSRDPASAGVDDLIIAFGTGQYLASTDVANTDPQTIYGVRHYDALTDGGDFGLEPRTPSDKFVDQPLIQIDCDATPGDCPAAVVPGTLLRYIKPSATLNNSDNGWFIDLDITGSEGERIVVNPKIRNDILFINSVIPDPIKCNAGGDGWLMTFNLQNGGQPFVPVVDISGDGKFNSDDTAGTDIPVGVKLFAIPAESTFLGDYQYTPDSAGNIQKRKVNIGKTQREGRMSWKEMFEDDSL